MTSAGPVAEMPIAPADGLARRSRDAKGGGAAESAERDPFPELLSRLADSKAGHAEKPRSRAEAGNAAEADRVVAARWRHMGNIAPFDRDAPPAEGEVEERAFERAVDSAASDRAPAGEPLLPMPQSVPQGRVAVESSPPPVREAVAMLEDLDEGKAGQRMPDVSALKAQPPAADTPADAGTEVEVKVAVLRNETHLAPAVLASLPSRAVDRPTVAPAADKPLQGRAVAAEALEIDVPTGQVGAEVRDGRPETAPVKAVPAGSHFGGGADTFGRARNGRASAGADGPAGERSSGGAASGVELRAANASAALQSVGPIASPVQQIADRIFAEVGAAAGGRAHSASPAGSGGNPATPVRVLHIELQPADLGTIEVRLSLRQDTLELKLEASRAESAALISRDRDALAGMLRSAGYLIDGLTVQVADADRSGMTGQSGGQGTHTSLQSSAQGQSGSSNPDAQSDRAGRQLGHENRSTPSNRDDNGSDQRSQRPVDGALYV